MSRRAEKVTNGSQKLKKYSFAYKSLLQTVDPHLTCPLCCLERFCVHRFLDFLINGSSEFFPITLALLPHCLRVVQVILDPSSLLRSVGPDSLCFSAGFGWTIPQIKQETCSVLLFSPLLAGRQSEKNENLSNWFALQLALDWTTKWRERGICVLVCISVCFWLATKRSERRILVLFCFPARFGSRRRLKRTESRNYPAFSPLSSRTTK